MRLIQGAIVLGIISLLYACGSVYAPTGQYGGFPHGGYGETRISADKYMVYFTGNRFNKEDEVKSYLLYRCAELTQDKGYDYFVMLSNTSSPLNVNLDTYAKRQKAVNYPRTYSTSDRISGYSVTPSAIPPRDMVQVHGASAYIQLFQGDIPPGLPNAFYARDILGRLGPPN